MIELWMEDCDSLLAIPVTFELQPVFIESATAVAMAQFVRIVVLECFFTSESLEDLELAKSQSSSTAILG